MAAPQYEYLWADGVKIKKPLQLSAPEYINRLYDWIEEQVSPRLSGARSGLRY
jgi:MOB kinase activator 1